MPPYRNNRNTSTTTRAVKKSPGQTSPGHRATRHIMHAGPSHHACTVHAWAAPVATIIARHAYVRVPVRTAGPEAVAVAVDTSGYLPMRPAGPDQQLPVPVFDTYPFHHAIDITPAAAHLRFNLLGTSHERRCSCDLKVNDLPREHCSCYERHHLESSAAAGSLAQELCSCRKLSLGSRTAAPRAPDGAADACMRQYVRLSVSQSS